MTTTTTLMIKKNTVYYTGNLCHSYFVSSECASGILVNVLHTVSESKSIATFTSTVLTLKVLNFWKFASYCSLKPLWSGMEEVVPARTSPTLHPPSPPTVHQLSWLAHLRVNWIIVTRDAIVPELCMQTNITKELQVLEKVLSATSHAITTDYRHAIFDSFRFRNDSFYSDTPCIILLKSFTRVPYMLAYIPYSHAFCACADSKNLCFKKKLKIADSLIWYILQLTSGAPVFK